MKIEITNIIEEEWKDIEGYEGLYQISNIGRVKSLKFGKEKILHPGKNNKGYLLVNLCKDGVCEDCLVHRLVAQAFIPNPYNKHEIDHIDTNPLNNNAYNLRWCTHKENSNNELTKEHLSDRFGKENPYFKGMVHQFDLNGNLIDEFEGVADAERKTGINNGNICQCIKGKLKTAGKYIWKRVEVE